jgi:hypothetical protein
VLVERWVSVVGRKNLTVVVVDDNRPDMLLRTFERFLGLPDGLLVPERGRLNRSLSLAEVELIRQLNIAFVERGWSPAAFKRFVRLGVTQRLQTERVPEPDEAAIVTPRWALARAAEIGAAAGKRIEGTGVRVIGDLSVLGRGPTRRDPRRLPRRPPQLPLNAALEAVLGAMNAAGVDLAAEDLGPVPEQGR